MSRDHELASEAARKGGQSSGGNFANDNAVGKLRILRILSGNRNGRESKPHLEPFMPVAI
ncbi:MAG: general stress protein [Methylocella sp.]